MGTTLRDSTNGYPARRLGVAPSEHLPDWQSFFGMFSFLLWRCVLSCGVLCPPSPVDPPLVITHTSAKPDGNTVLLFNLTNVVLQRGSCQGVG